MPRQPFNVNVFVHHWDGDPEFPYHTTVGRVVPQVFQGILITSWLHQRTHYVTIPGDVRPIEPGYCTLQGGKYLVGEVGTADYLTIQDIEAPFRILWTEAVDHPPEPLYYRVHGHFDEVLDAECGEGVCEGGECPPPEVDVACNQVPIDPSPGNTFELLICFGGPVTQDADPTITFLPAGYDDYFTPIGWAWVSEDCFWIEYHLAEFPTGPDDITVCVSGPKRICYSEALEETCVENVTSIHWPEEEE